METYEIELILARLQHVESLSEEMSERNKEKDQQKSFERYMPSRSICIKPIHPLLEEVI